MAVRDDLLAIAEPVVHGAGFDLVDLEYAKEGPRWVVRVFLHRDSGVSLDDCGLVSDLLSEKLDATDPVKNPYHLEVSSPGAERVLKAEREFRIFQGRLVRVTTRDAVDDPNTGKREVVVHGLLGPVTAERLQLTSATGNVASLERDNVKQVRLALKNSVPAFKQGE